jgi:hypothetical protein
LMGLLNGTMGDNDEEDAGQSACLPVCRHPRS